MIAYLHRLLQWLGKQQAGLLAEMTLGVASDRAAMNLERSNSEKNLEVVFWRHDEVQLLADWSLFNNFLS